MERGFEFSGFAPRPYQCYEANMPFVLRFMIDRNITGCCWVEAPKNTYRIRGKHEHISSCQMEIDIVYDSLVAHAPDGTINFRVCFVCVCVSPVLVCESVCVCACKCVM